MIVSLTFSGCDRNLEKPVPRFVTILTRLNTNKYLYVCFTEKTCILLTGLNLIVDGVIAKKLESVSVPLKTMTVIVHVVICSSGTLKEISRIINSVQFNSLYFIIKLSRVFILQSFLQTFFCFKFNLL